MDFYSGIAWTQYKDDELNACIYEICREKERRFHERAKDLAFRGERSGNEFLKLMAEAIRHKVLKEKPSTDRLGYAIANGLPREWATPVEAALYREMDAVLDRTDYVFRHTHYDECDNGYFFRRS